MKKQVTSFITFVREQGVMGLAIGFILGGAVNTVARSLVADIIQPLVGMVFGATEGLAEWEVGPARVGSFLVALIDFIVLAAVVFFVFKGVQEKVDKKKEK